MSTLDSSSAAQLRSFASQNFLSKTISSAGRYSDSVGLSTLRSHFTPYSLKQSIMEARLVQARKHSAKQPAGQPSFYVHREEIGGIPVSHDLYKGLPGQCLNISQERTDFLLDILGPHGAWNGWYDPISFLPRPRSRSLGNVNQHDGKTLMDHAGTF